MNVLLTDRLILRRFSLTDAPFVFQLMNSDDWLLYIGDRKIESIKDAEQYIQKNYLKNDDSKSIGIFVICDKNTGEQMGSCGLYKRDYLDAPDIGFALLPQFYNKGYAYESASALLDYTKAEGLINSVYGITLPNNTASIRLLKKLSLHQIGTTRLTEEDEELLLFST